MGQDNIWGHTGFCVVARNGRIEKKEGSCSLIITIHTSEGWYPTLRLLIGQYPIHGFGFWTKSRMGIFTTVF
jgi:hypothetical protein